MLHDTRALQLVQHEQFDLHLYQRFVRRVKSDELKAILTTMIAEEERHIAIWKCMVFVNIFFLHMRFPVRRLKSHLMKFYTTNLNRKRRLWAMHTPQKSPANAFVVSSSDLTMVW